MFTPHCGRCFSSHCGRTGLDPCIFGLKRGSMVPRKFDKPSAKSRCRRAQQMRLCESYHVAFAQSLFSFRPPPQWTLCASSGCTLTQRRPAEAKVRSQSERVQASSTHALSFYAGRYGYAGWEIAAAEKVIVEPHSLGIVSTKLLLRFPPGCYGRLEEPSGFAFHRWSLMEKIVPADQTRSGKQFDVFISCGCILYRLPSASDALMLVLFNGSDVYWTVQKGMTCAQLFVERLLPLRLVEMTPEEAEKKTAEETVPREVAVAVPDPAGGPPSFHVLRPGPDGDVVVEVPPPAAETRGEGDDLSSLGAAALPAAQQQEHIDYNLWFP